MTIDAGPAEHVVYSVDTDECPAIRYHAIPSDCTGTAATLDEARSSYRAQLIELLHVQRHDLPPVVEHIEAVVEGIRVREQMGTVHRDHNADRMLLQTLMADGAAQDELRGYVKQAAGHGADPVVLLVEPDETVAAVLDQMTPHDAVVVAYSDPELVVGWTAIYGPNANGANDVPPAPGDAGCRDLPIDSFARRYGAKRAVRVGAGVLDKAS